MDGCSFRSDADAAVVYCGQAATAESQAGPFGCTQTWFILTFTYGHELSTITRGLRFGVSGQEVAKEVAEERRDSRRSHYMSYDIKHVYWA